MFRSNPITATLIVISLCLSPGDASSSSPRDTLSTEINRVLAERQKTKKEDVAVLVVDSEFWEADGHSTLFSSQ
jgi:hypothetical protein